mgnify:CR=1 FL=1
MRQKGPGPGKERAGVMLYATFPTQSSEVPHFLLTLSSAERVSKGQALQAETALRYAPASGLDYSG